MGKPSNMRYSQPDRSINLGIILRQLTRSIQAINKNRLRSVDRKGVVVVFSIRTTPGRRHFYKNNAPDAPKVSMRDYVAPAEGITPGLGLTNRAINHLSSSIWQILLTARKTGLERGDACESDVSHLNQPLKFYFYRKRTEDFYDRGTMGEII